MRFYLYLTLLCAALYLPGINRLPPLDRDEARFAQSSRQMLVHGELIDIRFQTEPRYLKPIGIYWLQALSAYATNARDEIWSYRLPSFMGALAAVLLAFYFGKAFLDREQGFLAAVLLASSFLLAMQARIATADACLLSTVVVTQGILGLLYQRGVAPIVTMLCFWAAQAAGILLKGPVTPFISMLTVAALILWDLRDKRNLRWMWQLRPGMGVLVLLVICAPWFIAIHQVSAGGYWSEFLNRDFFAKLTSGRESHGFPPGFYTVLLCLTFWPASLFAPFAARNLWKCRSQNETRFCLAWVLPAWAVLEVVPTKLPNYMLPLFPGIALLCAHGLCQSLAATRPKIVYFIPGFLAGLILATALSLLAPLLGEGWRILPLINLLLISGMSTAAIHFIRNGAFNKALACSVCGAFILYSTIFAVLLPGSSHLWIGNNVKQALKDYELGSNGAYIASTYHEPSMVFIFGEDISLLDGTKAAEHLLKDRRNIAIVTGENLTSFLEVIGKAENKLGRYLSFKAFDYTKGEFRELQIYLHTP